MAVRTRAVILARVSSKAQEDEGYSLDSQLKLLKAYCENKDMEVVRTFKIAETASKQQSRKVFQELLNYIAANDIHHLAVEKTDRLTRNFRDAVAIDDWLEFDERRYLHAVKENLTLNKTSKSDVKFMWNIHLAVAKKYTDNLREEAMKGWTEKLAQGWLPSSPPPGYKTIVQHGKRIHVPDPKTKSIMQRVFKLYLEPHQSIQSIAEEMALLGVRTRAGHPYFKSKVQRILTNPFYIGINRFDGKEYPGAQDPIIDKQLFNQVQDKLHAKRPVVLKKHNPLLKNLITCEGCGGVVTWQKQKGRYYGKCQRTTATCKGLKMLREDKVEEEIMQLLSKLVCPSQDVIEWVIATKQADKQAEIETAEKVAASMHVQLERLERMDNQLYDDKLAGDITQERYEIKRAQFKQDREALRTKLASVDARRTQELEYRLLLLELSQKAAALYQKVTVEQKRLIIIKLFKRITLHNGLVSVTYTNFCRAIAENVEKTNAILGR